jgi:hypothetical protein
MEKLDDQKLKFKSTESDINIKPSQTTIKSSNNSTLTNTCNLFTNHSNNSNEWLSHFYSSYYSIIAAAMAHQTSNLNQTTQQSSSLSWHSQFMNHSNNFPNGNITNMFSKYF